MGLSRVPSPHRGGSPIPPLSHRAVVMTAWGDFFGFSLTRLRVVRGAWDGLSARWT